MSELNMAVSCGAFVTLLQEQPRYGMIYSSTSGREMSTELRLATILASVCAYCMRVQVGREGCMYRTSAR